MHGKKRSQLSMREVFGTWREWGLRKMVQSYEVRLFFNLDVVGHVSTGARLTEIIHPSFNRT